MRENIFHLATGSFTGIISYVFPLFLQGYLIGHIFNFTNSTILFYCVLVGLFMIKCLKFSKIKISFDIEDVFLYFFSIFILLGVLYTPDYFLGFKKAIEFIAVVLVPFFIARIYFDNRQKINIFLNTIYFLSILVSLIIIYRFIFVYNLQFSRFGLLGANPIPISSLLSIGLIIGYFRSEKSFIYYIIEFIILFSLLLNGSRSALLGIIICFLLYFFLFISLRKKLILMIILLVICLAIVFLGDHLFMKYIPNYNRYFSVVNPTKDMSISIRFLLYKQALNNFIENPLFGIGTNGFTFYHNSYPHNMTLELAAENGLIGLVLLYSSFAVTSIRLFINKGLFNKNLKEVLMVFIILLFQAQFSYGLEMHKNLFVFYALLLNIRYLNLRKGNKYAKNIAVN